MSTSLRRLAGEVRSTSSEDADGDAAGWVRVGSGFGGCMMDEMQPESAVGWFVGRRRECENATEEVKRREMVASG